MSSMIILKPKTYNLEHLPILPASKASGYKIEDSASERSIIKKLHVLSYKLKVTGLETIPSWDYSYTPTHPEDK